MLNSAVRLMGGAAVMVALASCGGGGDIAGDSSEFGVFPDQVGFTDNEVRTTNTNSCIGVRGARTVFTIVGGQAPFRIVNPNPEYLTVDKTEATGKDPKFTMTLTGGCGDPLTILVLDYHSRTASVEITVEREEEDQEEPQPE